MKTKIFYTLAFIAAILFSCDDKIAVSLPTTAAVYVVDAFIDTRATTQVVHLTKSQPYFDETLPPGVSGATVTMTDGNETLLFTEDPTKAGDYLWTPSGGELVKGVTYTLNILVGGETLTAQSKLGRVPKIDSITFEKSDFPGESDKDFYRAQFWATDHEGKGDTYWIRTTKNDTLLNKPSEINVAYDAAFSKGSNFDGFTFIQPIRQGINPDESDKDVAVSPYSVGDSVYVEIMSLTEATFNFLNEVSVQTNRPGGFGELFARPLANGQYICG